MMRNSILASALAISSLESLDGEGETAELNPVTEETTVAIDEILEEVRDGADSVEEHDDAVEDLEGAAESLESLIASLESAIADGGMNPQAADVHGRAMVNAVRRLPIDGSQYSVSVESFGGTGDKLQASLEAMQGAKDLLAKIWNAVKNAITSAYQAVVKFIQTIGKSGEALMVAGNQLKSSANSLSGEPGDKKVSMGGAGKYLHIDGKVEGSVAGKLKDILTNGVKVSAATSHAASEVKSLAGRFMSGSASASFEEGVEYGKKVLPGIPTDVKLPGGRMIAFDTAANMFKLNTAAEFDGKESEVAVPNKNEIKAIANEIIAVGRMIAEFDKKHFKALQKELDAFIAAQDKLVKTADYDKEEAASYRDSLKQFKAIYRMSSGLGPAYMSYAANAAKASFGFAKKAMAAYS